MTFAPQRSSGSRHVVLRAAPGDPFPESLVLALADEGVTSGWLRATGVLEDVELRSLPSTGSGAVSRHLGGSSFVLTFEAQITTAAGQRTPSFTSTALLAHAGETAQEVLAGEIVRARVLEMSVFVTILDDAPPVPAWSGAVAASARPEPAPPARRAPPPGDATPANVAIPKRPARPAVDLDALAPEPGDVVDHFAFGRGDVVRSDGDRLHVRIHRDGRLREIALEVLRVLPAGEAPSDGDVEPKARHFKLERRL